MIVEDIVQLVREIKDDLNSFCNELDHKMNETVIFTDDEYQGRLFSNDNINLAINIIKDFEYSDDQGPNATKTLHGAVAINKQQAEKLTSINEKKAKLRYLYTEANFRKNKRHKDYIKSELGSRFNARQAYRAIPLVKEEPSSVSFSLCKTKAIKTIDRAQAFEMIHNLGTGTNVDKDLNYLSVGGGSDQFAIVKKPVEHMRANIRVGQGGEAKQHQLKTPLPLFIYTKDSKLPKINKPFLNEKGSSKKERENEYLSKEPVLLSINAHAYIRTKSGKW